MRIAITNITIPAPIPNITGVDVPVTGTSGGRVGVAVVVLTGVAVGTIVGVSDAVAVGVGVALGEGEEDESGVADDVGVGELVIKVNIKFSQETVPSSVAAGVLWGTFGATAWLFSWNNLKAI